jgi:hypothetical protein
MTFVKHSIDADMAEKAVAAAAKKAAELKLKMCIAVADEAGDLKAFVRMDGAPKLSIQISQDKAFTAASFSMPTHAWFEFIKNDPPLLHGISPFSMIGKPPRSGPSALAAAITARTWNARGPLWRRSARTRCSGRHRQLKRSDREIVARRRRLRIAASLRSSR